MTNEELVYKYQTGDKQALNDIIEQNHKLVRMLANKFYTERTNSIDREDLEQEAFIGLILAANKYRFDIENPCQFSTYAGYWINQKISRFIKNQNTNNEISLNSPISDEGDSELMDVIEGVDYKLELEKVEDRLCNKELHKELDTAMNENISLRQREVLKMHHGWYGSCMTLSEIGEAYELERNVVQVIENKAMRLLRQSKWGRLKAKEFLKQRKIDARYSIPVTIDVISSEGRYL